MRNSRCSIFAVSCFSREQVRISIRDFKTVKNVAFVKIFGLILKIGRSVATMGALNAGTNTASSCSQYVKPSFRGIFLFMYSHIEHKRGPAGASHLKASAVLCSTHFRFLMHDFDHAVIRLIT